MTAAANAFRGCFLVAHGAEGEMVLHALLLLAGVVIAFAVPIVIYIWLRLARNERRHSQRGFEVKLSTGGSPVPREQKENDHG